MRRLKVETLDDRYRRLYATPSTINEVMPTLKQLAKTCDVVAEFGTCDAASIALLAARPKQLIYVTGRMRAAMGDMARIASESMVGFRFIYADTMTYRLDRSVDMLFIAPHKTFHRVSMELANNIRFVKRYVVFQDAVTCGSGGLLRAIGEYAPLWRWQMVTMSVNNNCLVIVERM